MSSSRKSKQTFDKDSARRLQETYKAYKKLEKQSQHTSSYESSPTHSDLSFLSEYV